MQNIIAVVAMAVAGLWAVPAHAYTHATHDTVNAQSSSEKARSAFSKKPAPGTKAKCLVMGHSFTVKSNTAWSKYKGKYYVFCCPGCKPKFDKNPKKYTGR